jgi:poly(hydroxyalkanoate) depolymerase family esterase
MLKITFFFLIFSLSAWATKEVSLTEVTQFGSNPGGLKMFYYSPKQLAPKAPLIVVLHGCTQSASEFDDETGWTSVAEKSGALLLFPQQTEKNNQSRCFNWFMPAQTSRNMGEAHSIFEMIEEMKKIFTINDQKVSIVGLSAGAAMTAVMLASYPEVFESGAMVAGIPFGCANNAYNAWTCMYAQHFPPTSARQRADYVRQASDHHGDYPRVLVIQGGSDNLVNPRNGDFNLEQWVHVHQLENTSPTRTYTTRFEKTEYLIRRQNMVTLLRLNHLSHGYPIAAKKKCGKPSKYIIEADFCASETIAEFFDLK